MSGPRSRRSRALIRVGVLLAFVGACAFGALVWAARLPINEAGARVLEGGTTIDPEFFPLVGQIGGTFVGAGLFLLLLGLIWRN